MHCSLPGFALLLAACSGAGGQGAPAGSFAAGQRDRLCVSGEPPAQRAGFIIYGEGDSNCSASGVLAQSGEAWVLTPRGEGPDGCRFQLILANGGATLAGTKGNCTYYCGPGASIRPTTFRSSKEPATDLAGDALC